MARDTTFFTELKQKVDLEDYLTEHLGVELVPDGPGRMAALCPFHDEDTPSFKVSDSSEGNWKRWQCFGACGEGGTIIDAVMKHEGFDLPGEAARYLNEVYDLGMDIDNQAYRNFAKMVATTTAKVEETKKGLEEGKHRFAAHARDYLHQRGFSDETIDHFQLGFDKDGPRLSIPLIDKANHPISIASRALWNEARCHACGAEVTVKEMVKARHAAAKKNNGQDWRSCPRCGAPHERAKLSWLAIKQHPKYLFSSAFDKSNFLYHERDSRIALKEDKNLIGLYVVEGYADVWAGWQSGHKAIVAYNGSAMSEWQARAIVKLATKAGKPVILVPDFDATGFKNVDPNIRMLRSIQEDLEVQVLWGLDKLSHHDPKLEADVAAKDLGDVLMHHGEEELARVLNDQRWQAAEWLIRQTLEWKNTRTGKPFFSETRQMELVAETLSHEKSKVSLDHMVPFLARAWSKEEDIIRNWFYSNLSEDNVTSYKHLFKDIEQARIESREFLQDDNVIPFGFKQLDTCMPGGGARPGQLAMFLGKALPLSSKILTPDGWKRMGDMQIGDEVVDPDGGIGRVTGVFPQGQRDMYRVRFSDGAWIDCDREHLWLTEAEGFPEDRVWTLGEIIESGALRGDEGARPSVPLPEPVELRSSGELPVDPYLLGALLGAGALRAERGIQISTPDPGVAEAIEARLPRPDDRLTRELRALGLDGARAHEKFVPDLYLNSGADDRLKLLRGLMDAGGCVRGPGRDRADVTAQGPGGSPGSCEFRCASRDLANGIIYVARSLGATASLQDEAPADSRNDDAGGRFLVRVSMPPQLNPFATSRWAREWSCDAEPRRRMIAAEPAGAEDAQCITVDTKRRLYITDDFIVTHNSGTGKTMLAAQILAHMADHGVRSIIFTLEQAAKSLYPRLACQVLDIDTETAERLIASDDPEDEKKLEPVAELYKNMLILDNVPTDSQGALRINPQRVQAIIQEANMNYFKDEPASVVIVDHLGVLEVDEDAPSEIRGSEHAAPGYIMQELFKVCKATDVLMIILQQLPKEVKPGVPFSYDAGRGGSKQTDYCDYIFQIWRPEMEEGIDEDEERSRSGKYMLALGKNRYGSSTVAHLFFDKDSLRIMPALEIDQSSFINPEGPVIDTQAAGGTAGTSGNALEQLAEQTDALPVDNNELFNSDLLDVDDDDDDVMVLSLD